MSSSPDVASFERPGPERDGPRCVRLARGGDTDWRKLLTEIADAFFDDRPGTRSVRGDSIRVAARRLDSPAASICA